MISIKLKKKLLFVTSFLFLNSCGAIQEYVGLSDSNVEKELISSTPELVLPPDFGKKATKSNQANKRDQFSVEQQFTMTPPVETTQPRVSNFFAPDFYLPSSKTPSDSLEKFKMNKRFTIGEWVYGQYVEGYKEGNIYYRPIYDKGYNFSRRYVPDQNINSFRYPEQQPFGYYPPQSQMPDFSNTQETNIENFGDLPILD